MAYGLHRAQSGYDVWLFMNFNDYFIGLSNIAEAIMLDTRIVFDGIDKASDGVVS